MTAGEYSAEATRSCGFWNIKIDYGVPQFQIPEILKVSPISERGTVMEIAVRFGGAEKLRTAINEMPALLYA
jgi:hypothetical protein